MVGMGARSISSAVVARVCGSVPNPGPMRRAAKRSRSFNTSGSQSSSGSCRVTTSVGISRGWISVVGEEATTIPAPARNAPLAASWAAPVIPGDPAMRRTAFVHLWSVAVRWERGANRSWSVIRLDRDRVIPRPRSAISIFPARLAPGSRRSPGFRAPKVMVCWACSDPRSSPVSPSTPEGISTANTGH